ncbi:hypothetical protein LCGC14_1231840 [marine sediment metagenome]|uniref:Uncharacterized protein n=1 Tax=marine sediment metagenome TaxID=412755 RepID=A0A0F9NQI3_9ZZZZ
MKTIKQEVLETKSSHYLQNLVLNLDQEVVKTITELEVAEARIRELEKALRPFAKIADRMVEGKVAIVNGSRTVILSCIDDFRHAREVLE